MRCPRSRSCRCPAHSDADVRSPRDLPPYGASVTDVWDLYGQLAEQDSSTLPPAQRVLIAVCDLRQEVNAGGFDNYFRAWGGNSADDALAALPSLLASGFHE